MSDNKQATNSLLKGINYLIQEKINKAPIDQTLTGVIKNVKDNNLYDVLIGGNIYANVPSIFKGFTINSTVKVKIPQGQFSQMYIEGKYNMPLSTNIDIEELKERIKLLEEKINQGGTK